MRKFPVILSAMLSGLTVTGFAQSEPAKVFSSSDKQIPLLELYTSEGCNSCPPADAWISTLQHHKQLWSDFVPVVFHVDYWDYLGWQDRFAHPHFSLRQRNYKKERLVKSVYTPGFVIAGAEWKQWFRGSRDAPEPQSPTGTLKVALNGENVSADFTPVQESAWKIRLTDREYQLNIAVLGMNIDSRITSGENEGKTLTHSFVVLGYGQSTPHKEQWETTLPDYPKQHTSELAVAFWLTPKDSQRPIQATGGWLTSSAP